MAKRLVRLQPEEAWQVTLLDRDNVHVYQPGLLFLPFGMYRDDELTRPRTRAGAELYACELAMQMFERQPEDLVPQVKDIITAGDFYDLADGAQIIFT